jgi:hypothetical protein
MVAMTSAILIISATFLITFGAALVLSPICRSGPAEIVFGTVILAAGVALALWGIPLAYIALGMKP